MIQLTRTSGTSYNWRDLCSYLEIGPGEMEEKGTVQFIPQSVRIAHCMNTSQAGSNRESWEWESQGQDDKSQGVLCHLSLYEIAKGLFL